MLAKILSVGAMVLTLSYVYGVAELWRRKKMGEVELDGEVTEEQIKWLLYAVTVGLITNGILILMVILLADQYVKNSQDVA